MKLHVHLVLNEIAQTQSHTSVSLAKYSLNCSACSANNANPAEKSEKQMILFVYTECMFYESMKLGECVYILTSRHIVSCKGCCWVDCLTDIVINLLCMN